MKLLPLLALLSLMALADAADRNIFECHKEVGEITIKDDCDEMLYSKEGGPIVLSILFCLALLFCCLFPCIRCCGGCGGLRPSPVGSDFCCTSSCNCSGSCGPDPEDVESELFAQHSNYKRSWWSPLYPCWSRFVFPILATIFIAVGAGVSISGLTSTNDQLDEAMDAADASIISVLDPLIAESDAIQTKYYSDFAYDAAAEVRDGRREALREVDKIRSDLSSVDDIRLAFLYLHSLLFVPLFIAVMIMACIGCNRNGYSGASLCHHFVIVFTSALLVYTIFSSSLFTISHLITEDICYEVSHLGDLSYPRGFLRAEFDMRGCPTAQITTAIRNLNVELVAAQASGESGQRQRELIDLLQPYEDCSRVMTSIATNMSPICIDLRDGMEWASAGSVIQAFGILMLIFAAILGYKRWMKISPKYITGQESAEEKEMSSDSDSDDKNKMPY